MTLTEANAAVSELAVHGIPAEVQRNLINAFTPYGVMAFPKCECEERPQFMTTSKGVGQTITLFGV